MSPYISCLWINQLVQVAFVHISMQATIAHTTAVFVIQYRQLLYTTSRLLRNQVAPLFSCCLIWSPSYKLPLHTLSHRQLSYVLHTHVTLHRQPSYVTRLPPYSSEVCSSVQKVLRSLYKVYISLYLLYLDPLPSVEYSSCNKNCLCLTIALPTCNIRILSPFYLNYQIGRAHV